MYFIQSMLQQILITHIISCINSIICMASILTFVLYLLAIDFLDPTDCLKDDDVISYDSGSQNFSLLLDPEVALVKVSWSSACYVCRPAIQHCILNHFSLCVWRILLSLGLAISYKNDSFIYVFHQSD